MRKEKEERRNIMKNIVKGMEKDTAFPLSSFSFLPMLLFRTSKRMDYTPVIAHCWLKREKRMKFNY